MPNAKGERPPGKLQERDPDAMTAAEERFVLELLKGRNQTRAYMAAYPKSTRKSAAANASRLIANDRVRHALQEGYKRLVAAAIADATERRMQLTQIMRCTGSRSPTRCARWRC